MFVEVLLIIGENPLFSFPFDWKTPAGYFVSILLQSIPIFIGAKQFIITLAFTTGFCTFLSAFVSDLEEKLRRFSEAIIRMQSDTVLPNDRIEIKRKIAGIIQFHSDAMEL